MAVYYDPNSKKVVIKRNRGPREYLTPAKALEMAGHLMSSALLALTDLQESVKQAEGIPVFPAHLESG